MTTQPIPLVPMLPVEALNAVAQTVPMAPKRKPAAGKSTPKLAAHNFLPMLTKPAEVIGDYVSLQGKEWTGCPAADKDKWFRCTVRRFEGVHDFGAFKSAAFQVQEMGQSGECSHDYTYISLGWFSLALFLWVGTVLNPTVDGASTHE